MTEVIMINRHGVNNACVILRDASEDADYQEKTMLFSLLEEKRWDVAASRAREAPEEASRWIVRRGYDNEITWRRLPIHEACIRQGNTEVVLALLDADPNCACERDGSGRLPLHHACIHGSSIDVVEHLLVAYPSAAESEDVWGKTPLDCVMSSVEARQNTSIIMALQRPRSHYEVTGVKKKKERVEAREKANLEKELKAKFEFEVEDILKNAEVERQSATQKVLQLEENLESMQSKYNSTSDMLAETTKVKHDLEGQLKQTESEFKSIVARLEERESELSKALDEVGEKHAEDKKALGTMLVKEKNAIESKSILLRRKVNTLEEEVTKLRSKSNLDDATILSLKEQLAPLQVEDEDKTNTLQFLKERVSKLEGSLKKKQGDFDALKEMMEAKEAEKEQVVGNLESKLMEAVETMTVVEGSFIEERTQHEEEVKRLAEELEIAKPKEYQATMRSAQEEKEILNSELERLKSELKTALEDKEKAEIALKDEIEASEVGRTEMKKKLQALATRNAELKGRLDEAIKAKKATASDSSSGDDASKASGKKASAFRITDAERNLRAERLALEAERSVLYKKIEHLTTTNQELEATVENLKMNKPVPDDNNEDEFSFLGEVLGRMQKMTSELDQNLDEGDRP